MKLSKVVFLGHVDGIFGESVSSLATPESGQGNLRQVEALEVTPVGLVVTKLGGERVWVPDHLCMSGQALPPTRSEAMADTLEALTDPVPALQRSQSRAKAR